MANDDIVMFLDGQGNEVSNDPRWIAEQTVRSFEDTVDDPDGGDSGETLAYSDRDAKTLKTDIKERKEAGREIDTTGAKKKADLVALLEADDEAQKQEALAAAAGDSDDDDEEEEDEDDDTSKTE